MARIKRKKLNKYERSAEYTKKLENALKGEGLYVFRNNTGGSLILPKPSKEGLKLIQAGQTFRGDSYFMHLLKTNEIRLVETIESPERKETMEKLIVDQPDRVTNEGTVEDIVDPKVTQLNEGEPQEDLDKDILLVEDPMDGIEIITD